MAKPFGLAQLREQLRAAGTPHAFVSQ